jgi:hypothetical protein
MIGVRFYLDFHRAGFVGLNTFPVEDAVVAGRHGMKFESNFAPRACVCYHYGDLMKTLVCALWIALCAVTAFAADATGKWSGTFTPEGQDPSSAFIVLKQTGASVTGTGGPNEERQWPITNGKIQGNRFTGECTSPEGAVYKLDIVIDGDKANGEITFSREGQPAKAKIELSRVKS